MRRLLDIRRYWACGLLVLLLPTTGFADDVEGGDDELPDGPVELRFTVDAPLQYRVETRTRLSYEDRPDFEPIYHSSMTVEYRPLAEPERDLMPRWHMDLEGDQTVSSGISLLATITDFTGAFEQPTGLTEAAASHQTLKGGVFSFRLTSRGEVGDIQVHPPTNPIARGSIEEWVRLLAASHPTLPEEPVEPGDSWSHELELSVEDDYAATEQHVELRYELQGWERCDESRCAVIDVEYNAEATGRFIARALHTDTASSATGQGQFQLDIDAGYIRESSWNVEVDGATKTERRADDHNEQVLEIDFHHHVDTGFILIDR